MADLLANGHVVGWFQGRMEFGPRALGARSIIGDPRNAEMQKTMNLKIKFRESFRPFAPVVLAETSQDYFDMTQHSPYMLVVSSVRFIPACVGNMTAGHSPEPRQRVHPRVCGEHEWSTAIQQQMVGSSPRVWGT